MISSEDDRLLYRAPLLPWLFPTRMAGSMAGKLHELVRERERLYAEPEDGVLERAAVHTREDLVLLVGWQTGIHSQLVNISRGVWILVALTIWLAWRGHL